MDFSLIVITNVRVIIIYLTMEFGTKMERNLNKIRTIVKITKTTNQRKITN